MTPPTIHLLVKVNVDLLRQGLSLLAALDEGTYAAVPPAVAPHRVGGHIRHILEFYECLRDGLNSGTVDYDSRRRDATVEASAATAIARIGALCTDLEELVRRGDQPLRVRMEDSPAGMLLNSTLARELQVMASHTIHHYALVALTLRAQGFEPPADFGMAPSTLRYLRNQPECERRREAA